jgi:DNA-binding NtrC family response regulator
MSQPRCRFHVIGHETNFQAVIAVQCELLGRDARAVFHRGWATCNPHVIRPGDTLIAHLAGNDGPADCREFIERLRRDGVSLPRIVIVADALDMTQEIELFRLGVAECLIRPLNLRRLNYLLETIYVKSQRLAALEASDRSATDWRSRLCRLAEVAANLLITGETGAGKSHIAKEIHATSARAKQPFVVVNCAAIPEHLIESDLFGHEKGAFTGADRKHQGKLEFAGQGTLFLDDVDAIPPAAQAKLLHAVENREFYPIGSNEAIKFHARLISATNRNLESLAAAGQFRLDLMYRLNTCELTIPPLRERRDEIVNLAAAFARQFAAENQAPVPEIHFDALDAMVSYGWPGNIRELRSAIYSGAIEASDGLIRIEHLPGKIRRTASSAHAEAGELVAGEAPFEIGIPYLNEVRRLVSALVRNNFNRKEAAADLGLSRTTLYHKLDKLKLS